MIIHGNWILVTVFEFDERFSIFGQDFVFYDYREPTNIPQDRINYYDIVIADPPFLSEECLTKTAETIKLLAKGKILLCTGWSAHFCCVKLLVFVFRCNNVRSRRKAAEFKKDRLWAKAYKQLSQWILVL